MSKDKLDEIYRYNHRLYGALKETLPYVKRAIYNIALAIEIERLLEELDEYLIGNMEMES